MKLLLWTFAALTILTIFLVTNVFCVQCTYNEQCNNSTVCQGANTPICEHQDLGDVQEGGGLCTCSVGACNTPDDCKQVDVLLNCTYADRHCYDNKCICSRFPIFPGN